MTAFRMATLNMKNAALAVMLMSASAVVLAQNTPAPAAVANAAAKPAAPVKPAETVAAKPAADSAKTPQKEATKDATKEAPKEPVAAPAKPAVTSKPVVAEVKKPLTTPPCPIAEFRAIGMETSDVIERRTKALDWLAKKGKQCSPEKLVAIRNNRPQWMGHADSTVVAAAVDALLESSIEGNPAVLNLLYGTQPPPPKPPEEKKPAK